MRGSLDWFHCATVLQISKNVICTETVSGNITEMLLCLLLDVYCSDVRPTTLPAIPGVDVMRIKTTTKASTTRMETTQLTSSQSPSPTKIKSTQSPREPEVDFLEKEKEAASMTGRYYH